MHDDNEIIIENAALDVSSDNYEEFDQELDSSKFEEKLVQENALKGILREYQIYASKYLLLNFREGKKAPEKKFRINLAYISSEPEHNKIIKWNWLYGALATTALFCLFIFLAVKDIVDLKYCLIGGAITLIAAVICSLIFVYLMRDEYIFKSQFGGIKLFLMDNIKPNQKDFDQFFIVLQRAIDKAQSSSSIANRLVDELKMCRRLKDEGIIDNEAYIAARTAIFKHKQYKA
ncbi:MAG: hypothetical protein OQK69_06150 [Gammaproteobacteria bacterium]|nr:hypothetical protein [Gammaproteobacteria bacterium]